MSTLIRALQGMSQGSRKASSVVNKLLTPPAPKASAQQPQTTVQGNIVQVGNKLRFRATPDGGVLEVLSVDGTTWLLHQSYKQT